MSEESKNAAEESEPVAAGVDPKLFRTVMGGFATGVAVITTKTNNGELHGMTVNSLTSVSLQPTLLLVSLVKDSRTLEAVLNRRVFAVNLLEVKQEVLSDRFARAGQDHFAGVELRFDPKYELPLLPGGLGHIICQVADTYPGGDHTLVVGGVQHAEMREGSPLVFFRGQYDTLTGQGREAYWEWYW